MKEGPMLAEIPDWEQTRTAEKNGDVRSAGGLEIEKYVGWPDVKRSLDQKDLRGEREGILKADSVATIFQTPL
jgi:hypothetical protein